MSGVLLGALLLCLVGGTGILFGLALGVRGAAELALTGYVLGFAGLVALFLLLSVSKDITQGTLIAGSSVLFVAAGGTWLLTGGRGLPTFTRTTLSEVARHRALVFLFLAIVLAFAYVGALDIGTPPNGWDPLNYHLARAAFWLQSRHIGYIEPTYDERLNLNPPNGEIGSAFVLGVTRDENLVGFVQFFAALACAVGVYALARRVGLTRAEAAFGGLIFLSLPIVVLQASLAKNDLVVASFLLAAAVFVLGERRRHVALAALATALAVGTKSTALYGVVVLLGLVLVIRQRPKHAERLAAVAVGALVGSYWYVVNAAETGRLFGDQSAQQAVTAVLHGAANLVTAYGMLVDTLDLSGAQGRDILLYGIAAAVVSGCMLLAGRRRRDALLAGTVLAFPFLLLLLSEHVGRPSLVHLYDLVGKPAGYLGDDKTLSPTIASDTVSWFGPVGFLCVLGALVATANRLRRRSLAVFDGALTAAPLAWFVLVAATLSYNPWLGRFFIFPVALSAAVWGGVLRRPAAAWGIAALGAITVVLTLVHYAEKPAGVRLLDRSSVRSVWVMKRWEVQSQHDPPLGPLLRFLDEQVPAHASVALALSENDFGYPAFGPHLTRHVEVVPSGSTAHDVRTDWLVASRERTPEIDASCWTPALQSAEGNVFSRSGSCG